jgi:hypothetical protein
MCNTDARRLAYSAERKHFFWKKKQKLLLIGVRVAAARRAHLQKCFWFFFAKKNCSVSVEYGTADPFRCQTCKSLRVAPKGATGDAPPLPAVPGLFRRTIPSATRTERS